MNGRYLGLVIFVCILLGCSGTAHLPKQVLRLNLQTNPATFDPRKGGDFASTAVHFLTFEGLTKLNFDGPTQPGVAEKIEISKDQKRYTFHLRSAHWSDGAPITAYDFEYAWKSILESSFPCPNAQLLYPIKNALLVKQGRLPIDQAGIKALSEHILQVELEAPTPYFLEICAFAVLHPVPSHLAKDDPNWATKETVVSNGPFVMSKFKSNQALKLIKNPHYWEQEKVHLQEIQCSLVESQATALQMFEKGELDMIGGSFTDMPDDAIPTYKDSKTLVTYSVPGSTLLTFNTTVWPFSVPAFRRALSDAINRGEITNNLTRLNESAALELVHPSLKSGVSALMYPHKEQTFDETLKSMKINLKDLPPITICYSRSDLNHNIAQTIQQQISQKLRLKVNLACFEKKILLNRLMQRDYQLALCGVRAQYMDPMNILERYALVNNPKNYSGWRNKKYQRLLRRASVETDPMLRKSLLNEAEKLFLEELPMAPVYHWKNAILKHPHVKNLHISPMGSVYLQEVMIDLDEKNISR